jgi:hypothetical protein
MRSEARRSIMRPGDCGQYLNALWFLTLADAREKMETWRRYHNEVRPHGPSATNRRSR